MTYSAHLASSNSVDIDIRYRLIAQLVIQPSRSRLKHWNSYLNIISVSYHVIARRAVRRPWSLSTWAFMSIGFNNKCWNCKLTEWQSRVFDDTSVSINPRTCRLVRFTLRASSSWWLLEHAVTRARNLSIILVVPRFRSRISIGFRHRRFIYLRNGQSGYINVSYAAMYKYASLGSRCQRV